MTSKVLCKYYMNGCCAFGNSCNFSHDMSDMPNQVCKFYLAGQCLYGDKCRYDHIKPQYVKRNQQQQQPQQQQRQGGNSAADRPRPAPPPQVQTQRTAEATDVPRLWAPAQAESARGGTGGSDAPPGGSGGSGGSGGKAAGAYAWPVRADECGLFESLDPDPGCEHLEPNTPDGFRDRQQQQQQQQQERGQHAVHTEGHDDAGGGGGGCGDEADEVEDEEEDELGGYVEEELHEGGEAVVDPADIPLCREYEEAGTCHLGDDCLLVHGDHCQSCGMFSLHPYNPDAAEAHRRECATQGVEADRREGDKALECGICLERVLQKPELSQRRFGLMTCDHIFCLQCIRSWRATAEVDVESALRTCPLCRITTHFVTPSNSWPASPDDKARIVQAYKEKMAAIDCMHYDFGEGSCPFGTSCFYRHARRDGSLEPPPNLRRAANEEGEVRVLRPVTLSSFLDTPQAQRLLAAAPRRGRGGTRR